MVIDILHGTSYFKIFPLLFPENADRKLLQDGRFQRVAFFLGIGFWIVGLIWVAQFLADVRD